MNKKLFMCAPLQLKPHRNRMTFFISGLMLLFLVVLVVPASHAMVDMRRGSYSKKWSDLATKDNYEFFRTYDSFCLESGIFGPGWKTPYDTSVYWQNGALHLKPSSCLESGLNYPYYLTPASYADAKKAGLDAENLLDSLRQHPQALQGKTLTLEADHQNPSLPAGFQITGDEIRAIYGNHEVYDLNGRIKSLYADYMPMTLVYDAQGRLSEIHSQTKGFIFTLSYPSPDTIVLVNSETPDKPVKYLYDKAGDLVAVTNFWGNTFYFRYGSHHNLTQNLYPDKDKTAEIIQYNPTERFVIGFIDRGGCTESYKYTFAPDQVHILHADLDKYCNSVKTVSGEYRYTYDERMILRRMDKITFDPNQLAPTSKTWLYDSYGIQSSVDTDAIPLPLYDRTDSTWKKTLRLDAPGGIMATEAIRNQASGDCYAQSAATLWDSLLKYMGVYDPEYPVSATWLGFNAKHTGQWSDFVRRWGYESRFIDSSKTAKGTELVFFNDGGYAWDAFWAGANFKPIRKGTELNLCEESRLSWADSNSKLLDYWKQHGSDYEHAYIEWLLHPQTPLPDMWKTPPTDVTPAFKQFMQDAQASCKAGYQYRIPENIPSNRAYGIVHGENGKWFGGAVDLKGEPVNHLLFGEINDSLNAGAPVSFDICVNGILPPDNAYEGMDITRDEIVARKTAASQNCEGHAILITGRRPSPRTGDLEFLVRNSWGKSCSSYNREIASECEAGAGSFWIDAERLIHLIKAINQLTVTQGFSTPLDSGVGIQWKQYLGPLPVSEQSEGTALLGVLKDQYNIVYVGGMKNYKPDGWGTLMLLNCQRSEPCLKITGIFDNGLNKKLRGEGTVNFSYVYSLEKNAGHGYTEQGSDTMPLGGWDVLGEVEFIGIMEGGTLNGKGIISGGHLQRPHYGTLKDGIFTADNGELVVRSWIKFSGDHYVQR
jgi:YD repeat-containing protein